MRDDEDRGDEPDDELNGFAVRNVSEFFYAGRPPVIVRTTHLQGPGEDRQGSGGPERLRRERRTVGLRA